MLGDWDWQAQFKMPSYAVAADGTIDASGSASYIARRDAANNLHVFRQTGGEEMPASADDLQWLLSTIPAPPEGSPSPASV